MSWIKWHNHSDSTHTFPPLQQSTSDMSFVERFSVLRNTIFDFQVINIKHSWLKQNAAEETAFLKLSVVK